MKICKCVPKIDYVSGRNYFVSEDWLAKTIGWLDDLLGDKSGYWGTRYSCLIRGLVYKRIQRTPGHTPAFVFCIIFSESSPAGSGQEKHVVVRQSTPTQNENTIHLYTYSYKQKYCIYKWHSSSSFSPPLTTTTTHKHENPTKELILLLTYVMLYNCA